MWHFGHNVAHVANVLFSFALLVKTDPREAKVTL